MKKEVHVVGAVIYDNGKILCAQRGPTKTLPYKWEFPGGKIEPGELPQEALQREIYEEMDCLIDVEDAIESVIYEYDFAIVHLTTYLCKLRKGSPSLKEHNALKWLYPHELATLDWAPADIPTVEKLEKENLPIHNE